ncbi:Pre-mRNA branch site p14-like protein [Melipona quadrifasciata]|uniref:Splicing factor 3B subunit 6 n=1 Tax=Melipona quadrifasciata TaxID=166423 RepID=A0A0M8ZZT1_9HYME|nr:Pre-mRNA branch site p14-like protein [Melipona quadrifasciata]
MTMAMLQRRANVRLPPEVNRVLYIRNLPYKITAEEMYDIFGKYGAIRQIRVGNTAETRGTAFVVYEDIFDAKNACDHLSGFNVCNRYLVVLYYQSNKAFKRVDVDKKMEEIDKLKTNKRISVVDVSINDFIHHNNIICNTAVEVQWPACGSWIQNLNSTTLQLRSYFEAKLWIFIGEIRRDQMKTRRCDLYPSAPFYSAAFLWVLPIYSSTSTRHITASRSIQGATGLGQMSFDCCGSGKIAAEAFVDGLGTVSRIRRTIYESFFHDIHFMNVYYWLSLVIAVFLLKVFLPDMVRRIHVMRHQT